VASVVPLTSLRDAEFLNNELPGAPVPEPIMERMRSADAAGRAPDEGMKIALEILDAVTPLVEGVLLAAPQGRYEVASELLSSIKRPANQRHPT
jgi:homocysteine S-methyltransferase